MVISNQLVVGVSRPVSQCSDLKPTGQNMLDISGFESTNADTTVNKFIPTELQMAPNKSGTQTEREREIVGGGGGGEGAKRGGGERCFKENFIIKLNENGSFGCPRRHRVPASTVAVKTP